MTVYDLLPRPGGVTLGRGAPCFLYAASGNFSIRSVEGATDLSTDRGSFATGEIRVEGEGTLWIYEVAPPDHPLIARELATPVLSRLARPGIAGPWLIRADRVELTAGSATPRHGHRGPGMRRLVSGRILAEIGDEIDRLDAGRAWFETGRDWVVGTSTHEANSIFVRVMVLPIELQGGKSSFIPATPEDAAKPRPVTYRLFGETVLD
jgi:hypothetical protein